MLKYTNIEPYLFIYLLSKTMHHLTIVRQFFVCNTDHVLASM